MRGGRTGESATTKPPPRCASDIRTGIALPPCATASIHTASSATITPGGCSATEARAHPTGFNTLTGASRYARFSGVPAATEKSLHGAPITAPPPVRCRHLQDILYHWGRSVGGREE